MNIAGAFWAPFDSPDPEADVRAQADAWMEAEPNVLSHRTRAAHSDLRTGTSAVSRVGGA